MGNLATKWKTAKDSGEKAFKEAKKAGKKCGFPAFKSDFQKTLDKLETSMALVDTISAKLRTEYASRKLLAEQCKVISAEYQKAVTDSAKLFDGPATRSSVLDAMKLQLERLDQVFAILSAEKSPV